MACYRRFFSILFTAFAVMSVFAQSGTNSPYSQYGLGVLSDQSSGFNRGMNGLGLGFREHNQVNFINPASYSSMDSLMFLFDAGLSGQITSFTENGKTLNAKNADFEYVVAGFRAFKHVGVSFGILPYTNIGYNYSVSGYLDGDRNTIYTNSYSGSGGIHQAYFGIGWEMFKGVSIGTNVSYLWGDYERAVINSYSDAWAKTLSKYYTATVNSYKLEFGMQYVQNFNKKDAITLGVTYGLGHKLGATPQCDVISTDPSTATPDTTSYKVDKGLAIPETFGVGLMWNHNNQLKVGVDYNYQKWGSIEYPVYTIVGNTPTYKLSDDYYDDRHKFTIGGEFCKNAYGRNFFNRIRFRAGASYATPYYKVNGQKGPREISVSAGCGIPIMNGYNSRSILNVSGQWVRSEAKGLIKENTFRINIGLTFNERWFMKWKVE